MFKKPRAAQISWAGECTGSWRTLLNLWPAGAIVALGAWLATGQGWRQAALWLLGAGLGSTLWISSFSFAGAFRRALAERRTVGVRAQFLMLAVAVCLIMPALELGTVWGQPVRGFVFPTGVALILGAFLFGIGMQLGGGCASGTLYAAGGGASRSWLILAAFVAGATVAAWDAGRWLSWPSFPPVSLPTAFGLWPALLASLTLLACLGWLVARVERRRHGSLLSLVSCAGFRPLAVAAMLLALLNFATLLVAGRPWAITAAFPLWGSKLIEAAGLDDPAFWTFWEDPTRTEALLRPVWTDRTSIMDVGLICGAAMGAVCSGAIRRTVAWPGIRPLVAALLGGLLLGYGAVLATGCNISAFFGGVASGSLHGWVWIVPALCGNAVGLLPRRFFHLDPPRT